MLRVPAPPTMMPQLGAHVALLLLVFASHSFVSAVSRPVIGVLVDRDSRAAERVATRVLEAVLLPLSREFLLDLRLFHRPLRGSTSSSVTRSGGGGSGEGGDVAGWFAVTRCCSDVLLGLCHGSVEVPVLGLHLAGERCHGVPAVPLTPACPPSKDLRTMGGVEEFNRMRGSEGVGGLEASLIRSWVKAVVEGREPVRTRLYGIDLLPIPSSSPYSSFSDSPSPVSLPSASSSSSSSLISFTHSSSHLFNLPSSSSSSSFSSSVSKFAPLHRLLRNSTLRTPQPRRRTRRQAVVVLGEDGSAEVPDMFYSLRVKQRAMKVLSGTVMTVAMLHRPPYVSLVTEGRTIVKATGILLNALDTFSATFNFSYVLKLPDDDQWGALKDGRWTGMVGEVHRREVEMALGPTSITEAREKAIDFTVPFDYEPWDILIPESIVTVDLTAYLFPFANLVWIGIMASTLLVGTLVWIVSRLFGDKGLLYPAKKSCKNYTYSHYLLDMFGCLIQQANRQPQTSPMRMLAAWWWVFCVVVIASYSSKLISSLTVRFTEPPVKSLKDLVESRKLLWTYLANSAMEEVFKFSAPDTLFGKVGQLHKERPGMLVYSFEEGVAAVRSKKFAYFEDNSWLEFAVADDLALHGECRMTVVRDSFFYTRFGIILQAGSPFRDALSAEILQIIQSGLMDAWKKQFWPQSFCTINSHGTQPLRPLNLQDLFGTMILMLGGSSLAILALLGEILFARHQSAKNSS
ncbi:probable glutamate receptor isoform X2 [Eriocheir sinensis]|uniref:probable glutamate receptor isoform X2 n=1 Tax=Eriocheir sinensis TaxID=95602 RepID=UPI0021C67369|nr:probable glutamate receptor isoform X2 [Eriocheir sinensis]